MHIDDNNIVHEHRNFVVRFRPGADTDAALKVLRRHGDVRQTDNGYLLIDAIQLGALTGLNVESQLFVPVPVENDIAVKFKDDNDDGIVFRELARMGPVTYVEDGTLFINEQQFAKLEGAGVEYQLLLRKTLQGRER